MPMKKKKDRLKTQRRDLIVDEYQRFLFSEE
jgi:uncharacterized protein YggL (DUF469 family)